MTTDNFVTHGVYILDYGSLGWKVGLSERHVFNRVSSQGGMKHFRAAAAFTPNPAVHRKIERACHLMMASYRVDQQELFKDNPVIHQLVSLFDKCPQRGASLQVPSSNGVAVRELVKIALTSELNVYYVEKLCSYLGYTLGHDYLVNAVSGEVEQKLGIYLDPQNPRDLEVLQGGLEGGLSNAKL